MRISQRCIRLSVYALEPKEQISWQLKVKQLADS